MANAALGPVVHALFTQVAPFLVLAGVVGLALVGLVRWVEQRAPRLVRAHRHGRSGGSMKVAAANRDYESIPDCPMCNVPMVKRAARRGPRAGEQFWGCSNYPMCRSTKADRGRDRG